MFNNNISFRKKAVYTFIVIALIITQGYLLVGFEIAAWQTAHALTEQVFTQFITAKPIPVAYAKVDTTKINPRQLDEIARKIQILESSGGKNDGCKKKGLVNGYGYRQNSAEIKCFDSKTDVKRLVEGWFYEKLKDYTLAQAVCTYNSGRKLNNCSYYQNYLKLK